MEPANPYAPPEDLQSGAPVSLADLDLSKLTPQQRKFLETAYTKSNISWHMALWQAGCNAVAIAFAFASGRWVGSQVLAIAIAMAGYLALGYWARTWSRLATFLLLLWHVLLSYNLLYKDGLKFKLIMLIPSLIFFLGYNVARAKFALIKKAAPEKDTGPRPVPKPVGVPSPVSRPVARKPGE